MGNSKLKALAESVIANKYVDDVSSEKKKEEKRVVNPEVLDKDFKVDEKLENIFAEAKNAKYECSGTVYIDGEIKEALNIIKIKCNVDMSNLVSYILENWLLSNKEQLQQLLKRSNKFF